jgi:DNA-binding beta-propeller fold protein YncE
MKTNIIATTVFLFAIASFISMACKIAEEKPTIKLDQTVAMPNVKGRIDHLVFDAVGQRIFLCALGNGSLEIIDVKNGTVLQSIKNLSSPQGILFIPDKKKIIVACGGDGFVRVFDSEKYSRLDSVYVGNDADNMRFDSLQQKIYVASDNGMTILNLSDLKILKNVELEGHPESFQIDRITRRMFVNVPDAKEVEVIDMKSNIVSEKWGLMDAKENFPMSVDETNHRVFIACRHPSKIIVMDDQTGNVITAVGCSGDADDLFYDVATKQIFISCGEGFIDVFKEKETNVFSQTDHLSTRFLARTGLFVSSEKKFFLAVPATLAESAELRSYTLIP